MSVSKDEINSVAKLARLDLPSEKLEGYTTELNKIFGYIDRLRRVNTEGVEPLVHTFARASTPTRKDLPDQSEELASFRDTLFEMAPQAEGRYFKVPKMN